MLLQIDDWKFDIDMEATMAYSAKEAADHCTCAYCRNFYAAVDSTYPHLRSFLAQFGLDIEAPDEMYPIVDGNVCYDPVYAVYGKILKSGSYEMAAGLVNIVARPAEDRNDCFMLECYEVFLPWILDEPIEDVISPANEPTMLEKLWDKLLGKAKKSDFES